MNNNTGRKRVRRARKNESIKRILLTICMMAMVAAISIGGTLAWLTDDTEVVTNKFTTTDIEVSLEETTGAEYEMVPGRVLDKDPFVTLEEGSENAWVFVVVTEEFDPVTVEGTEYGFADYLEYEIDEAWTALGTAYPGVYYKANVEAGTELNVLTDNKVTVPNTVTKAMMNAVTADNYPELSFVAYAVQAEGITSAEAAWTTLFPN